MRILGLFLAGYALSCALAEGRTPVYLGNDGRMTIQRRRIPRQPPAQLARQQPAQTPAARQQSASTNTVAAATNAVALPRYYAYPVRPAAPNTNAVLLAQPLPRPARVSPNQQPAKVPTDRGERLPSTIELHYETNDPLLGFQQANAAKGFPESQYVMGMRYLSGIGVTKDEAQARHWLEAAASQGNEKAKVKLRELKKAASPAEGNDGAVSASDSQKDAAVIR